MTALILLSHGSRHPHADQGVEELRRAVARRLPEVRVEVAHLDFSHQDLPTGVRKIKQAGHEQAVVVPLLFTHAFHGRIDVPREVANAAQEHQMELRIADGLGTGEEMAKVLRPLRDDAAQNVLYSVGSSVEEANQAVAELAEQIGAVSVAATRGGVARLEELLREHARLHVISLFVTHGLLLDMVHEAHLQNVTITQPLGAGLAGIVVTRFEQALEQGEQTAE